MIFRYHIEVLPRRDLDAAQDRLRELGVERWELVSVLPGSAANPADPDSVTCFFRRDASSEIGL